MYPCTCLLYFLLGLPNLKSTTTIVPLRIITRSGRRLRSSPFSCQIMSHSLNSCQVPEYQSLICGCEKALWVNSRISSSVSVRPITPSNTRRLMASSISSSVSMAEKSVCSKRPRLMKRWLDSASSTPAMKSAERLDWRNSMSCRMLSMCTGSFTGFCASLFTTLLSVFPAE